GVTRGAGRRAELGDARVRSALRAVGPAQCADRQAHAVPRARDVVRGFAGLHSPPYRRAPPDRGPQGRHTGAAGTTAAAIRGTLIQRFSAGVDVAGPMPQTWMIVSSFLAPS